jgi:guanosine-3',5'-bis(diphosphate) 3'-pyrophosphohydrolase
MKNKITEIQTLYQDAIKFAADKHLKQKVPGTNLPYIVHLCNVSMEIFMAAGNTSNFNLAFAVQVALLHDTIEDTSVNYEEIKNKFGKEIADAVQALSKNEGLPIEQQTLDSLTRIKKLSHEVWSVKLADRITNLQIPPSNWSNQKRKKYQEEARLIWNELKNSNNYLAIRLKDKIEEYTSFIEQT